jgi:hypothetical protein
MAITEHLLTQVATTQETQTMLDIFLNNLYFTTSLAGGVILMTFIIPRLNSWSAQMTLAIGLSVNMFGIVCVRGSQWVRLMDPHISGNVSAWLDYIGANAFGTFFGTLGLLIALHPLVRSIWKVSWLWSMVPILGIAMLMTYAVVR